MLLLSSASQNTHYVSQTQVKTRQTQVKRKSTHAFSKSITAKQVKRTSKHAFSSKAFPINSELLSKVQLERRMFDLRGEHEDPQIHKIILSIQNKVLDHILNAWTLSRISDTQLYGNDYSVYEVIDDLTDAIFNEYMNGEVSSVRRNLQTSYVRRLIGILAQDYYDEFATAAAYKSLRDIEKLIKRSSSHEPTKAHRNAGAALEIHQNHDY